MESKKPGEIPVAEKFSPDDIYAIVQDGTVKQITGAKLIEELMGIISGISPGSVNF